MLIALSSRMQISRKKSRGLLELLLARVFTGDFQVAKPCQNPMMSPFPRPWKFQTKIFSVRDARMKSLVKFFYDTHGTEQVSKTDFLILEGFSDFSREVGV